MLEFKSSKVKEFLLEQVSQDLQQPLDVIEKVITFQGEDTLRAFYNNRSIEISGFVKFWLSDRKMERGILAYTRVMNNFELKEDANSKIQVEKIKKDIDYLKSRLC